MPKKAWNGDPEMLITVHDCTTLPDKTKEGFWWVLCPCTRKAPHKATEQAAIALAHAHNDHDHAGQFWVRSNGKDV